MDSKAIVLNVLLLSIFTMLGEEDVFTCITTLAIRLVSSCLMVGVVNTTVTNMFNDLRLHKYIECKKTIKIISYMTIFITTYLLDFQQYSYFLIACYVLITILTTMMLYYEEFETTLQVVEDVYYANKKYQ